MNAERWRRIEELYRLASGHEAGERSAYLDGACEGDKGLRREVELLLAQPQASLGSNSSGWETATTPLGEIPIGAIPNGRLAAGVRLGPYRIEALLGAGGMGEVYRAVDTRLGRDVAIKVSREQFSARFEREARAISSLNHPNICTLYDIGPNYLVTELVVGETLRDWLKRASPMNRSLEIAKQVGEALGAAHRAGIVHRDLKPANVMVRFDGYVKVLDFGIAKRMPASDALPSESTATMELSHPGQILGTVPYMSPEQILGQELDQRSDLFAFGILLYEILAKRHPWTRPSSVDTMHAILHDDPPPIAAPLIGAPVGALERVVRRCLAKQPGQRFQTMGELLAGLDQAATELTSKPAGSHPSIAVLPFANMSADKENEYFGDGLAEEIINVLANVPGMKVTARTSSFFFKGKDVEFGEIGRRLNVEHILEGSVRKAGNRIRVMAQLIKVTDGFHLWSERYDREMTDIFAIQDEVTQSIAAALRIKLSVEDAAPRRHVPNLRAYEAYLKARQHWLNPTPESLAKVKELVDHAINLDPKFALAYSLLGGYYSFIAGFGIAPAREVIPLACAAEHAALRVDPSLPEAHALLGVWAGNHDFDWNEAERRWRLAMAHEPVSNDVRFWYGNHYLVPIGRLQEAVETMARALQEDPLNLLYRSILARGLINAGRLEDAETELRKALEIDENYPPAVGTLGAVCAQQGRFDEALTFTEKAYALTPWANVIKGQLAALLVRAGDTDRANALIEKLQTGAECGAPTGLAVFHAMRGEFDQAAEWTEKAIEERYPPLIATLRPLLQHSPRWPALAKMMNLRA